MQQNGMLESSISAAGFSAVLSTAHGTLQRGHEESVVARGNSHDNDNDDEDEVG